jgi:hypothetical protein
LIELHNQSQWAVAASPDWDRERKPCVTIIIKQAWRFDLDGSLALLPETPPVEWQDKFCGDPACSSLVAASEVVPFKAGAEVYLFGTAWPADLERTIMELVLGIEHADGYREKRLHVSGHRHWQRSLLGMQATAPSLLKPTPLRYENTWGGRDSGNELDVCAANPAGTGYTRHSRSLDEAPLPAIMLPGQRVSRAGQQSEPAGYGPIPVHWEPRAMLHEPCDEQAVARGACPYPDPIPADIHNYAPLDQRFAAPFRGDELVLLQGFFEARRDPVRVRLPGVEPLLWVDRNGGEQLEPVCDTLIIDTDLRQLHLVYRASIAHPRTVSGIVDVVVQDPGCDQVCEPRQEYA